MKILTFPDTTLKNKSTPIDIDAIPDDIGKLIEDMKETLVDSGGIGLAAPQVGCNVRIILVQERVAVRADTSSLPLGSPENAETMEWTETHVMINPEIIQASNTKYTQVEGCLSFPGVTARINRHEAVTARWFDPKDKTWRQRTFQGLAAACVQHEIDHLDGVLIPDRIGPLRSKFTAEYFRKQK